MINIEYLRMDNASYLVIFIAIIILVLLVVLLLTQLKKNTDLKLQIQQNSNEIQLSINKNIQDNFFQFQSAIFNQFEHSVQHNKFVYDEMDKNSAELNTTVTAKLAEIKTIVDEKLHRTLEERLGHSFKLVADSLDKVQTGLGEMQVLASGVGDLKRVLSNIKTRGILGEIQLGNILEQILSQEQFGINVATIPNSNNSVEFAVKFPGNNIDLPYIWLPIDSKFPMENYERLLDAHEAVDKMAIIKIKKDLAITIKHMASEISSKYIYPPYTTDFGIMFLPTESLYAEILRIPGLIMEIQNKYKVMLVGPNNLAAFLTSLRQGFKSVAVERRTDEVWKLLNIVKSEFSNFGQILDKTQRKILEANKIIESAGAKSRNIERKLNRMEKMEYLESENDV